MDQCKFIMTADEETYKQLKRTGFTYLNKTGKEWVFLNDGNIIFMENDPHVRYTNVLCI